MTLFCRQVVYKLMSCCVFQFNGRNLVFKMPLDLQYLLHNKTVIGFGFCMIVKLSRLRFMLSASAFGFGR